MNKEIERKYLVKNQSFIEKAHEIWKIRQGFVMFDQKRSLRIREDDACTTNMLDDRLVTYTLCLKISHSDMVRDEYEYRIPPEDGLKLLEACPMLIEKTRYRVMALDKKKELGTFWDVDVFHGKNEGLIVAEMELKSEDQPFEKPDWVGEEVTNDPRYLNTNLSKNPYTSWGQYEI